MGNNSFSTFLVFVQMAASHTTLISCYNAKLEKGQQEEY